MAEHNDDLFESTKMTFGEHLEELRGYLFRAVIGLVVGVAVGLILGERVVKFIKTPVEAALTDFYKTRSEGKYTERLQEKYEAWLKEQEKTNSELPVEIKAWLKEQDALQKDYEDWLKGQARSEESYRTWLIEQADPDFEQLPTQIGQRIHRDNMIFDEVYVDLSQYRKILGLPEETPPQGNGLVRVLHWRKADDDRRISVKSLSVQEAFMIWLKAGFVAGLTLASPWIFYQVWLFVAAGLYPHEKRYVHIFLPFSVVLFLSGAALAFFFVFQYVLNFLFRFNASMGIDPDPRISEWLSFVLFLPLGFGIAFQLPLVMLFLERIGVFSVATYLDKWRIAVLVIAVLSMLLTPADPMSMLLMFVPMTALYFGGIGLCRYMPKARSPFEEE